MKKDKKIMVKYRNEIIGAGVGFCIGLTLITYNKYVISPKISEHILFFIDSMTKYLAVIPALISTYISLKFNIWKFYCLFFLFYFVLIGVCFGKILKLKFNRKKIIALCILVLLIIHELGLYFVDTIINILGGISFI